MLKEISLVDVAVIHEREDVTAEVTQYFVQESNNLFLCDVIPEEHSKQSQSLSRWADGNARNHRDSII